jgi:NADH-quinone oxidoreductase subunit H
MSSLDQVFVSAQTALFQLLPEALRPWAGIAVRIGVIAALAPAVMMYLTLFERKVIARMQNRFGPTRVGVYGLMQPLSDGLKMLIKEDIVPRHADRLLHMLAPVTAVAPVILLFAVLPIGRNMVAADLNVGLLYIFAVASVGSFAIFTGGWASRSKFSTLGAMRAVAQLISYEVPGALSVVALIMVTGTLSMVSIVDAQAARWFLFTPWGFVAGVMFFLCGVAECNRTPFDMPEAESELTAGFHTEYSGMKFALWYLAEFLEAFLVCGFTVTLFLGGWQGPAVPFWLLATLLAVIVGMAQKLPLPVRAVGVLVLAAAGLLWRADPIPSWLWFTAKTYALFFVLVWFRGTFPRLRADQLMGLAWKFFLPMALLNIFAAGVWVSYPFPMGTIASVLLLAAGAWGLVRINQPASSHAPRTYVLAD